MSVKNIFLACFFFPLVVSAQSDSLPLYKIYSVERKQEVSLETMVNDLLKADVVFFGEEHNDSVAHVLQLNVLKGLYEHKKSGLALSMEMFQSDVQLVLDEYRNGLIRESNLDKDGRLWKNYKDYRPVVEFAKENKLYILAANAPSRYTNRVTRSGLASLNEISKEAKALLAPLPVDTLTGRYYEKFSALMGNHMGSMKIYQSQNLWDATMAWRISRLAKQHPKKLILHLNGRFHTDEKLGTYAQLKRYAPKLRSMNISSFSHESFAAPQWDEWQNLGDFIIITDPSVKRSF